jgi:hypothetical protein
VVLFYLGIEIDVEVKFHACYIVVLGFQPVQGEEKSTMSLRGFELCHPALLS